MINTSLVMTNAGRDIYTPNFGGSKGCRVSLVNGKVSSIFEQTSKVDLSLVSEKEGGWGSGDSGLGILAGIVLAPLGLAILGVFIWICIEHPGAL